ncbi:site-specific DNA-methyltransferase [Burkholderia cepacia]|uniref:site-specific DNA-methyltransferase n=1 Tax=Burkholderia cepacia TaxID=292 RepID=UPI003D3623CE
MSRLTDLIAQAKAKDQKLGADLDREFKALSSRLPFGLNFERHRPEAVELPQRPVRKGDKVRVLPPRGTVKVGDRRLWQVKAIDKTTKQADLVLLGLGIETQTVALGDLVVVAEFSDTIHPGLVSTGKVQRGGEKPFHTVINGENYHVLNALTYTHRGKIDAIYIDPPYNTGAKDWKYNNDYVEGDDLYRHSKWLAMIERRLLTAKELLNPDNSVLIITIDEKEVHRLGLLLEQVFPEAAIQMCTIVINPSGTSRGLLSRVEEYAFFAFLGAASPCRVADNLLTETSSNAESLTWESLLRRGNTWYRQLRPNLCYPVLIDPRSGEIKGVGAPFDGPDETTRPRMINGLDAAWPVRTDGRLGIWRKDGPGLMKLVEKGFAYATAPDEKRGTWSIKYLMSGTTNAIEAGTVQVERTGERGQVVAKGGSNGGAIIKTVWNRAAHNAGMHGSALLRALLPGRSFPFPKALYAVEDALRAVIASKKDAIVLDFFSGSGTTAHAVMRLNRQDDGRRQCISVTNNEVAADEQKALRERSLRPGDPEWEQHGICDFITKPRVKAVITGETPDGQAIKGDYKFIDEFPMADGFEENAEFFTLTYETPVAVSHGLAFGRIAPLLWLRAGARGQRIDKLPGDGWAVVDAYGVLTDVDAATPFIKAVKAASGIDVAYIVTDDDRRYQAIARRLPDSVEPVRLYESYLTNFSFTHGD